MNKKSMKQINEHTKDVIIIMLLAIISLFLGALFLRVEELKVKIPNQTHALLENTIRYLIREEFTFDRQNFKFIIEENEIQNN